MSTFKTSGFSETKREAYVFPQESLLKACENGDGDALREIIAEAPKWKKKDIGERALLWAAKFNNHGLTTFLIDAGYEARAFDKQGDTALHYAVNSSDSDLLARLLKANPSVDKKNRAGETALWRAAKTDGTECVRLLLAAGANWRECDTEGWGTVMNSALHAREESLRLFLDAGADPNSFTEEEGMSLLMACAGTLGAVPTIKLLLARGARLETKSSVDGWTALHFAALDGPPENVMELLAAGADISARTGDGWEPIHIACNVKMNNVELLLKAGAYIDSLTDDEGLTPLHVAAAAEKKETVELLLSKGATPNIVSKIGETAAGLALKNGNEKIFHIISKAVAQKERESMDAVAARGGNKAKGRI